MNFLPDEVVPDRRRDGDELCRKLLGQIGFYIEVLKHSGIGEKHLEKMFAEHVSWHRNKTLKEHERAMMCALATVITSVRPGGSLFKW